MRTDTGVRLRRRERGIFTLVEVLLATMILALAATATAYWVETVGNLGRESDDRTTALSVVQSIESVISPLPFREPGSSGYAIGPERGEDLSSFDDVDDFDGFAADPPIDGDRQPQTGLAGWKVTVAVEHVDPGTLAPVAVSDLRKVEVVVTHGPREVAREWWLRARGPFE